MYRRMRPSIVVLSAISLALLLSGCPKRPMVPVVAAPPPAAPAPQPAPPPRTCARAGSASTRGDAGAPSRPYAAAR